MAERRKYTKELAVAFSLAALAGCSSLEERNPAGDGPSEQNPTKAKTSTPVPPTETSIPTPTRTPSPTLTPTPTPDWRATQEAQWINLENAERKEEVELNDAEVTRILFAGSNYWVEANIEGEEGVTLLQSDCVKDALEEEGELGRQVRTGIYEPGA